MVVKISKDEHWKAAFDMFQQSSLKRMRLSATAAILAHSASVQPPLPFPASAPAASSSAKRPRSDSAEAAADAREKKKAKSDEDEKGGEDEKGDDDVLDAKHDDSKGKKDKAAVVKSSKSSGTEPKKAKGKSQVVCCVLFVVDSFAVDSIASCERPHFAALGSSDNVEARSVCVEINGPRYFGNCNGECVGVARV